MKILAVVLLCLSTVPAYAKKRQVRPRRSQVESRGRVILPVTPKQLSSRSLREWVLHGVDAFKTYKDGVQNLPKGPEIVVTLRKRHLCLLLLTLDQEALGGKEREAFAELIGKQDLELVERHIKEIEATIRASLPTIQQENERNELRVEHWLSVFEPQFALKRKIIADLIAQKKISP